MANSGGWTAEITPQRAPQHHPHYYSAPALYQHDASQSTLPSCSSSFSQPYNYYTPSNPNTNPNPGPITGDYAAPVVEQRVLGQNPYASHGAYEVCSSLGYSYPPASAVGVSSYYSSGADGLSFSAKEAIRQYGMDPLAYDGTVIARPPNGLEQTVLAPPNVMQRLDWQQSPHSHQVMARYPNGLQQTVPPSLTAVQRPDWQLNPYSHQVTKKGVKGMSKVVQSAYCEVCKIDCNSEEMLKNHKYGKKHQKNLEKLKDSISLNVPPKPMVATTYVKEGNSNNRTRKRTGVATEEDLQTKKMKVLDCGAAADAVKICTMCNVVCNSEVVFNYHLAGQRHAAMLKKQKQS